MDNNQLIILLIFIIVFFIIFRIKSLMRWMRLNIDMKKGTKGKYSPSGYNDDLSAEYKRQMRLKKHKLALRQAKIKGPRP